MIKTIATCFAVLLIFSQQAISVSAQESGSEVDAARKAFQLASKALEEFNSKHSRTFEGGRVPIHYLDWADEGTPLVLLHGTYSSAHDFVRFAPKLIEAGYRPISVDWYGHGKTPIPEPVDEVSVQDFAKNLNLLFDSLGIEKAVIAGHSRGGVLAGKFFKDHPERVSGLVLIDGGSTCAAKYFSSLGEKGLGEWMDLAFDKNGEPTVPTFASLEELFIATWERFGKPEELTEMYDVISQSAKNDQGRWTRRRQDLLQWLGQDTRDNTFNGMLNPEEAPLFFGTTVLFEPLETFAELDVPVLILDADGSNERYRDFTPAEENEQLQQLHPELITHIKMPAGHFLHRAMPVEFVDHLWDFRKLVDSTIVERAIK